MVTMNGNIVSEIGTLVDPEGDVVEVGGERVRPVRERLYIAAYKPAGVVVTGHDPQGRKTVYEALPTLPKGIFTVGRLDMDSEGLLLLMNDGKLAHRLSHPRFAIERVYEVITAGPIAADLIERLTAGVTLDDGVAIARTAKVLREDAETSTIELTLTEGRKREIRRMFGACGVEVRSLKRTMFGVVSVGDLTPGAWRYLTRDEVRGLRRMVEEAYVSRLKGDVS